MKTHTLHGELSNMIFRTLWGLINVASRLFFFEKSPRTLLGPPRLSILPNFSLSNCKIFKCILPINCVLTIFLCVKSYIVIENELISSDISINGMILYLISRYGFPNLTSPLILVLLDFRKISQPLLLSLLGTEE